MRRRLAGTRTARLLMVVAAGWLLAGCGGAYAYLHDYVIYRGFAAPVTPAGIPRGSVVQMRFRSQATGATSPYLVYLPPGYRKQAAAGRRFPVLYLLHGHPGKMPVWLDVAGVDVVSNELIAAHRMRPMLIVMPSGKQGALGADTEWADTPSGNWMSYVRDVVTDVDQHFATIPDRQHRGIGGVSEGAYGATNIALRNLDLFSVLEGGGPYFTQTPNGVYANASAAQLRAASPAAYLPSVSPAIHRSGLRAWLFQGRSDRSNPQLLRSFVARLQAAGAHVTTGFYAGGHDWRLFRRKTPEMLVKASRWFAQHP